MNRKTTPMPEPVAQLQRQLDHIAAVSAGETTGVCVAKRRRRQRRTGTTGQLAGHGTAAAIDHSHCRIVAAWPFVIVFPV